MGELLTGTEVVLAVDLGGTTMKGAVVTEAGSPLLLSTQGTSSDPDENLAGLLQLLEGLSDEAQRRGTRPVGVGVVTPGIVDHRAGVVSYAANLGWKDLPLREQIRRRIGTPVEVEHDARAAGMAESLVGCARGVDHFVHLPIGTGIASAIITDGDPWRGAEHAAGELGHVPVHPSGELCVCGQRGCLEVYASGAGIARRYRARTGSESTSAEQVVSRIGTDSTAAEVWDDAVEALALGIVTTTLVLDPALVVIGGGVSRAGDILLDPLRRAAARRLAWRHAPTLEVSGLGSQAGRIGASMVAMTAAGRSTRDWTRESTLSSIVGD